MPRGRLGTAIVHMGFRARGPLTASIRGDVHRQSRIRNPTWVAGIAALVWLLLRSGGKPSRMAYPCQQTALATASLAFGAPLVAALLVVRRRCREGLHAHRRMALSAAALLAAGAAGVWGFRGDAQARFALAPPADYRAQVYDVAQCPHEPAGERFPCLDDLVELMGAHGLKLYRSDTPSLVAGPEGILGRDDVVLIKINYQWPERGGTNVDLLRGLIRRILDHPDAFDGEVVVLENTQTESSADFDRPQNNAEDHALSPRDVVEAFRAAGHRVSLYDLSGIRNSAVGEYDAGNFTDGYVVLGYDIALHGRVSYPKFRSADGTSISLERGVWTAASGYDRERLKLVNVPVLKSHHAVYGATGMVKNYMGVLTTALGTNSHLAVRYGILGSLIGRIRPADLNLLDAIWINADPYDGPWTSYTGATRTDRLVAALDPVAGDVWAVKNILVPAFEANGHTPPWPAPSADPDDPTSAFREYLDNSMGYLLAAGWDVTNDPQHIDAVDLAPPGEAADPAGGGEPLRVGKQPAGYTLSWSAPLRGGPVEDYLLYRVDLAGLSAATTPQCVTGLGALESATLGDLPDDQGLLVVAGNGVGQGSFGENSFAAERPAPAPGAACP